MRRILMIATGGIIVSKRNINGLKPLITSEETLFYVSDTGESCQTDTLQLFDVGSTSIRPMHWLATANAVEERYTEYDSFIICHGTDAMAYTAAALSYLIQNSRKPIVITGAQEPTDMETTDAKANPSDSLLSASYDSAYGINIVLDSKVITGIRGKKERTKSYNAFSSTNFPYIASVQGSRIIFYLDDRSQLDEPVTFYHKLNPNITLLKLIPSMDVAVLDYMAGHCDAIIIESFGVGGLLSYEAGAYHLMVEKWVSLDKTVVMITQITNKGSSTSVYGVGHSIKQKFGLLEAYDMTLEATVTKLMWMLGQTKDAANVRQLFYTTMNRNILWK